MPLDTVLLLDTSGSMAGKGIKELKHAAIKFVEGVEQTATETGLKENISVVEFGKNKHVIQPLTNDYRKVKAAIHGLQAGGRTPMVEGLVNALAEIMENGGVVKVHGQKISPRVILFTDGVPTDENGETIEAKVKVLQTAAIFGKNSDVLELPFAVPVACIGCGDCDPELLEGIARVSKGMFKVVVDIDELSGFFKKQVLLIRFIAKCGDDMAKLKDELVLKAFLEAMGEAVAEAELKALLQFIFTLLGLDAVVSASSGESAKYPALGSRVVRGANWKWANQDGNGPGTIVSHKPGGIVGVLWDNGNSNNYRHGAEDAYDLKVIDSYRTLKPGETIKVGVGVQRGKDWKWGDQDGGRSNVGAVYEVQADKWVKVRWPNGTRADYRYGADGKYDLKVVNLSRHTGTSGAASGTASATDDDGVEVITALSPRGGSGGSGGRGGGEADKMAVWQFQDDRETWRFMAGNIAQGFEKHYQKKSDSVFEAQYNGQKYSVNFKTMVQTNTNTKKLRRIKRTMMEKHDFELALAVDRSLKIR